MKHKLKTTLCSAIFSTLFLLNSCQVENEVINNGNDVKIEKFSFSNIKSLQKRGSTNSKIQQLAEAVNHAKIKLIKRNSQSRLIYDENLGIYFDDEAGIKISKEDYESYTFKIYRDNTNENSKLENLIFSENKNGGFDSYLVEYPYTEQEMLLNSGENLQNSNAEFTVLNKATEYICIGYVIYSGCSETHSNGVTCSGTEVSYDCYSSGGNGSSTGGSTGGTETGASTGGSSGVLTSPTPGGGSGTANTPCNKIKGATSNNSGYMNNFKNINKPTVLNQPMEKGFSEVGNQYIYGQAIGGEAVKIPTGAKNFTHTHPNRLITTIEGDELHGNVKMHSPADLEALLTTCQNSNANPTNAFGVMISDEGIFAITLLEAVTPTEISQINPKWNKFKTDYEYESGKIISEYRDPLDAEVRKEKNQKLFLKLLKDLGLENKVGLFEGEEELDINVTIKWTRKKLNASGSIVPEGC